LLPRWFGVAEVKVAVSVFTPEVFEVSEQVPFPTGAEHVALPSLTCTVPVGVPLPGATTTTDQLTAYCWNTNDGLGELEVIVVVVAAGFTVWVKAEEVLPLKFGSLS
jgi:hypothetical protein